MQLILVNLNQKKKHLSLDTNIKISELSVTEMSALPSHQPALELHSSPIIYIRDMM